MQSAAAPSGVSPCHPGTGGYGAANAPNSRINLGGNQVVSPSFECRLDCAHDLANLLAALQLREKDMKDQRVHCEASPRGLKFVSQSSAKDVAVIGWMMAGCFEHYRFLSADGIEELHVKIPVGPLLNCLQIFSDRAGLAMRYPDGPDAELHLTMRDEGAVTECRVRTLFADETPSSFGSFFGAGEPVSVIRPKMAEFWHSSLQEFAELDSPDAVLRVALRVPGPAAQGTGNYAAVCLRCQSLTGDAEVELPRDVFEDLELDPQALVSGEVLHHYPLTSVLASCLRASKESKGVKIRFNRDGVMSSQFILRGRTPKDLFCESMVSPLAEGMPTMGAGRISGPAATQVASTVGTQRGHHAPGYGAGAAHGMGTVSMGIAAESMGF